jgi:hypothetical protein
MCITLIEARVGANERRIEWLREQAITLRSQSTRLHWLADDYVEAADHLAEVTRLMVDAQHAADEWEPGT